jgi:hypothetical protein
VLFRSNDFLATDLVAARLMDFNVSFIAYLVRLAAAAQRDTGDIKVVSEDLDTSDFFNPSAKYLLYRPPHGWERMSLHGIQPGNRYEDAYDRSALRRREGEQHDHRLHHRRI